MARTFIGSFGNGITLNNASYDPATIGTNGGSGYVTNSGALGGGDYDGKDAVSVSYTGQDLTVTTTGTVVGESGVYRPNFNYGPGGAGGFGIDLAVAGSIDNSGTIKGGRGYAGSYTDNGGFDGGAGGAGIYAASAATVSNTGLVEGGNGGVGGNTGDTHGEPPGAGGAGGAGIILANTGTIMAGGTIIGGVGGAAGFPEGGGNPYGNAGGVGGAGIVAEGSVVLTVLSTGTIIGGAGGAAGSIYGTGGAGGAGLVLTGGGTLFNAGSIIGGTGSPGGAGVQLGLVTATITNAVGGYIAGGTGILATNSTQVENFGTIKSVYGATGTAVALGAGGELYLEGGSQIVGIVTGGGGVLDLDSAGGIGTLTGYGSQYVNFSELNVVSGANWVLSSNNTFSGGLQISDLGTLSIMESLVNSGTFSATSVGTLSIAGILVNSGTLSDTGAYSLTLTSGAVFENYGTASIFVSNVGSSIVGSGGPTTVVNGGYLQTGNTYGIFLSAGGVINNTGTINAGGVSKSIGSVNGPTSVYNSGVIVGTAVLNDGGTVTNASGGYITALNILAGGNSTIVNAGTIRYDTNLAYESAANFLISNTGRLTGLSFGRSLYVTSPTYGNGVLINGTAGGGSSAYILGGGYGGIGVSVTHSLFTFVNYGTVVAAYGRPRAVSFYNSDALLVLEGDDKFIGDVVASGTTGTSILEFGFSNGAGTVVGLGTQYSGFSQYSVLAGAHWTLSGNNTVQNGATLTNAGTLLIAGNLTIDPSTMVNSGYVSGSTTLGSGSYLSNTAAGTITAAGTAIYGSGGAVGVDNFGLISATGPNGYGIYLGGGGSVTNAGSIGGYAYGVKIAGAGGTVANTGTITMDGGLGFYRAGIALRGDGAITNGAAGNPSALISGESYLGIVAFGTATVVNYGTVQGRGGIGLHSGGVVINEAGGVIDGLTYAGSGVGVISGGGTVLNYGNIAGLGSSAAGIFLASGGSIANEAGAVISGYAFGIQIHQSGGTIVNSGTVAGTGTASVGIEFSGSSGRVQNARGAAIYGSADGVVLDTGGTVINSGTISAGGASGTGVYLSSGGIIVNTGPGAGYTETITGATGIRAAGAGAATVKNFGYVSSLIGATGTAVAFGANPANALYVEGESKIIGTVTGGGGVLVFDTAGGPGQLSGFGTQYVNFNRLTLPTGANWTLSGSNNFAAALQVNQSGYISVAGTLTNNATVKNLAAVVGGTVINAAGGYISGGVHVAGGFVSNGVLVSNSAMVANAGRIVALNGVYVTGATHGTIVNSAGGSILGSSGTISSATGISATASTLTLTNYGTIATEGTAAAVFSNSTVTLVVEGGSEFVGSVDDIAPAGPGNLEFGGAHGAGVISGLGSHYSGFARYTVLPGATWTLSGNTTIQNGATLTNAGTLLIAGNLTVDPSTMVNSGYVSGTVTLASGSYLLNTPTGVLTTNGGTTVYGSGGPVSVTNQGSITNTSDAGAAVYLGSGGTVTNSAGTIAGFDYAVEITRGTGTVTNYGLLSNTAAYKPAVYLLSGGLIANQPGGTIAGGLYIKSAVGTITNLGTISATVNASNVGAALGTGGVVDNGNVATTSALIEGMGFGVQIKGGTGTVVNDAIISATGPTGTGVYLANGGTVSNALGAASIAGNGPGAGVLINGGPAKVVNSGFIEGQTGVQFQSAGSVTNGGYIAGGTGILLQAGGYVGDVVSSAKVVGYYAAVLIQGNGGSVINSGVLAATGTDGDAIVISGGTGVVVNSYMITAPSIAVNLQQGGSVNNTGTIVGTGTNGTGLVISGGIGTVTNSGVISGGTNSTALLVETGGKVTNAVGGLIQAGYYGLLFNGAPGTIVNSGAISATQAEGAALRLTSGGSILNIGTIQAAANAVYLDRGTAVTNSGTIIGRNGIDAAPGTIVNSGGVTGTAGAGIYMYHGGVVTNYGTIAGLGTNGAGITMHSGGGTIINSAGVISGGRYGVSIGSAGGIVVNYGSIVGDADAVVINGAVERIVNRGAISATSGPAVVLGPGGTLANSGYIVGSGGTAVALTGTATRLILTPGATLMGSATASYLAGDTLELSGASGIIGGLGGTITGFSTIVNDANASWLLAFGNTLGAATTLSNEGNLDITGTVSDAGIFGNDSNVNIFGGAVLSLAQPTTGTGLINFSEGGTLRYEPLTTPSNSLDLVPGAIIDLPSFADVNSAVLNGSTLTVSTQSQSISFTIESAPAVTTFETAADGLGGTDIIAMGSVAWNNPSGGNWSVPTNWTPNVVPDQYYNVTIGITGNYTVNVDGPDAAASLTISDPGATVAIQGGDSLDVQGPIVNSGLINITGNSNATAVLIADGAIQLSGGGTVTLSNQNLAVLQTAASGSLENINNTIIGQGTISGTIINDVAGTIESNGNGASLTIDSGSDTVVNQGLIETTNSGPIVLLGTINNSGGTIVANSGDVTLLGATIIDGALVTSGGGFQISGNATSLLDGTDGLSNAAPVHIQGGNTLGLIGTIVNSGTLDVTGNGNQIARLVAESGIVELTGGGSVTLDNATLAYVQAAPGATLDNTDNTLIGQGLIFATNVINESAGKIETNGNGAPLQIVGGQLDNVGLIETTNSGPLDINTATIVNLGGTISAGSGDIGLSGATILGGLLTGAGGAFQVSGGAVSLLDGTNALTNAAVVHIHGGNRLDVQGTILNSGVLDVTGDGNSNAFLVASSGTVLLSGGGTIALDNHSLAILQTAAGATLDNIDNTIIGQGQIGDGVAISIINEAGGAIEANGNGAALTINTGTIALINKGLIETTNSGPITINSTIDNSGGTISLASGDVTLAGATIINGVLNGTGGAVQVAGGATSLLDGTAALGNAAVVHIHGGNTLDVQGTILNSGVLDVTGDGNSNAFLVASSGTVVLSGGGAITLDNQSFAVLQTAAGATLDNIDNTIIGQGQIGDGAATSIINEAAGTIEANGNGAALTINTGASSLVNKGLITTTNSGPLVIQSTIADTGGTISAGSGAITVIGAVTGYGTIANVANQGVLLASGGTLVVSGSVTGGGSETIASGGVLELTAGATVPGAINFTGGGGVLRLDSLSGPGNTISGFVAGDTLDLDQLPYSPMYASAYINNGTLTVISGDEGPVQLFLAGVANGTRFDTVNDGSGGTLVEESDDIYSGTYRNGIVLSNPAVQNPTTITATAYVTNQTMSYAGDAVYGTNAAAWLVSNAGTIVGTGQSVADGIRLVGGGTIVNSGNITGALGGVDIAGATGTVINYGHIAGLGAPGIYANGVYLQNGGYVANRGAGAVISGVAFGVLGQDNLTVINSGTIATTGADADTITADDINAATAGPATIVNFGLISHIAGSGSGSAIYLGAGGLITNYGTISGSASGSPPANGTGGYPGVISTRLNPTTVVNLGLITNPGNADGVNLLAGGLVINGT
ncbi:MAG: hypothetical protein JO001_05380, partial [Alphaproteobacteria bacterium]|nr:hypothetical protein [Alphaproteobacteria bacterium]